MSTKRLSVVIDADTSGFTKSVNGMQSTMSKATGGLLSPLKKVGGAFTGLLGGIGKIAGAVGVFKLIDAGINMITSSFDGAISRVDTLKQFPKVMKQMGFEAEETDRSLERLVDGIQGLPTTLDGITGSTQRLAIILGDLDEGTETALALNNAFLASGASQEDASRGLEQYIQMLSSGKVDMQSWKTLQETMPYALNETAKAFGFTGKSAQNDLYAALQDGTITFEEFNDQMIKLSNGTGGFAEVALEASKGISTSWQNIKTAVVTGVANVITAFDDWLESAGFGGIAGVLDIIKVKVQEAFKSFLEWVPKAIDKVTELYDTITSSTAFQTLKEVVQLASDKITEFSESSAWESIKSTLKDLGQAILDIDFNEVLAGIQDFIDKWGVFIAFWVGAFAVFKTITFIMTLFTALGTVIAFLTSPIGIVVVAITALIAIGIALWRNWDKIKAKASEIWGSIKDFFSETWESIKTKTSETWNGIKDYLSGLWQGVKDKASEIWDGIKTYFSELWQGIKDTTSELWEGIKESLSDLWEGIVTSVSEFFTPIIEFFTTLWEDVKSAFETGWETITNVLTVAWMFIEELFGLLLDIIMIPWNFIWENFAEPLTDAWEGIKTYLSEALDTISNWISEKWESIKTFTSETWDSVKENIINPIKDAWDKLKAKVQEIKTGISDKWDEIKTATTNKWNEIKTTISNKVEEMKTAVTNKVEEIKTGISNKWNEIKSDAQTKWNEVKDRVVTPIKDAWNQLKAKVQEIKTGISTKWNEIKTDTQTKWNEVKTRITTSITDAWNSLKGKLNEIKSGVTGKWNEVKSTTTSKWNEIKSSITKPITDAWNKVKEMVDKIKNSMNFSWSLPKLKMPKFTISGKFGLNPPSVPKMGISWYAKGGIATGPSVVGIGEAGDEAILPLSNKSKMKPFASAVASMMPSGGLVGAGGAGDTIITGNTFVIREEADIKKIAYELKRLDDRESRSRGRRGLGN